MDGWMKVLVWWLAFAGSHIFLSWVPVRRAIIARIGASAFAGLYSMIALATFVPLGWTYWVNRHTGPLFWDLRALPGVSLFAIVLGTIGIAFVASSFAQPSPTSMDPRAVPRARGMSRITRHPLFTGLALWGAAHLPVNGFLSDIVFFAGFPIYSLIGAIHQDSRKQTEQLARLGPFYGETSLLPFAAVVGGRNRLVAGELPWIAFAIGIALALVIYYLHPVLFA